MQPSYNEMFLFRIGDCATKHQQLLSLRVLVFGSKISYSEEKHFVVSGLHQPCHIFSTGHKGGQSVGRLP